MGSNQNATAGTFETSRSLDSGAINTTRFLPAAGSVGAVVESTQTRNEYGEPANYNLRFGALTLYSVTNVLRDLAGRVLSEREQVGEQTFDRGYGYDEAGRLEDVWLNGELAAHYAYDANGNRVLRASQGLSEVGVYEAGDRVVSYGGWNYDVDDNGRLRSRTEQATGDVVTYGYDSLGALRSVESEDGVRVDYGVDMQARRVRKSVNGVVVKRWLYQDALRIVAELSPSGQVESRFVYGDRGNVPSMMVTASQAYRIVSDVRGSVRLVVNVDSGAIVQRLDYDEFGRVLTDTNPGFQPFGFAGGLYDADTGLVRFGARDYDAYTGRWTARDPALFGGGQANLYAYVHNDPINYVDITGEQAVEVIFLSRSIGGNEGEALRPTHHAGVVVNFGDEAWIIEGGPAAGGALFGYARKAKSEGWYADFSHSACWDTKTKRDVPVRILGRYMIEGYDRTGDDLQSLVADLNQSFSGTPYVPPPGGPNSNTYARMVLEQLGIAASLPGNAPPLGGWGWP